MKTTKIINSAINGIYKKNPERWMLQEDGEISYLTNIYVLYKIKDCPLKAVGKLESNDSMKNMFEGYLRMEADLIEVGEPVYQKVSGKDTINIYKMANDEKVAINKDLLKHFENYTLKSPGTKKDIVGVYEHGELVGIVCPVKLSEY